MHYVLTGEEFCAATDAPVSGIDAPRMQHSALARDVVRYSRAWVAAVLPIICASSAYRLFMTEAYPAVRAIVEGVIASGLIYLPSHAADFKNPDIDRYLAITCAAPTASTTRRASRS